MFLNRYNAIFTLLLFFHTLILLYLTNNFSISFDEAYIYFYDHNSILSVITNLSTHLFGQNDFALRIPFILLYVGSSLLLYLFTYDFFRTQLQRVISISIFMLLPGLNSAALLVNESIIVVFLTLLYLVIYKFKNKHCYLLLILFLFIDNSFAILFLGLFFFSLAKKDNKLLIISLILFGLSMFYFGFSFGGKPKSYLLDTIGIYASIFSPILFLYFFYSIYRIGIKEEKDIVWYISATALALSLIFSLRQQVKIEDFAPFVVIAIPLMVRLFSHSLNVRLKEFRKFHYNMLYLAIGVLLLSFFTFVFNQYIYLFLEKPERHFAYKYHIAKELSWQLKKINIDKVYSNNPKLSLRLQFYGIKNSKENYLSNRLLNTHYTPINIVYFNRIVKRYYLYNLKPL